MESLLCLFRCFSGLFTRRKKSKPTTDLTIKPPSPSPSDHLPMQIITCILSTKPSRCASGHLPMEIIACILSKLPIRAVLRCKSVCKTWYSITTNPHFHDMHFNSSAQTKNPHSSFLLLPQPYQGHLYIIEKCYMSSLAYNKSLVSLKIILPLSNESSQQQLFLMGSSNGLLCFSSYNYGFLKPDRSNYSICICNPITQDYTRLPDLKIAIPNFSSAKFSVGFCFDPVMKQFKLIQIFHYWVNGYDHMVQSEVQLYVQSSNSLRKVTGLDVPNQLVSCTATSVYANGSVHWLAFDTIGFVDIVSFDFEHETFQSLPTPELSFSSQPRYFKRFRLGVLGGCLCLSDSSLGDRYEIWVMKEYNVKESWTKQFVLRRPLTDYFDFSVIYPVFCLGNDELVLQCGDCILTRHNVQTGKSTDVRVQCDHSWSNYQMLPYVGNLIFPKSSNTKESRDGGSKSISEE